MKFLMCFDEFGKGMNFPSIKTVIHDQPGKYEKEIIEYLKTGRKTFAATGYATDVISNEVIKGVEYCGMTDGEYSWMSTLPYYVKKYHVELPKEFVEKVIEN